MPFPWLPRRSSRSSQPRAVRSRLGVEPLEPRNLFDAALGARFVTGLYYDLLHRQPSEVEVASWTAVLNAGVSDAQVVLGILSSDEYRSDEIRSVYQDLLHRDPDPGAIPFWLGQMQRGLDVQQLRTDILASDEYFQEHGGQAATWLAGLYTDVLGRAPDPGGVATWDRRLLIHESRAAVALSFEYSEESDFRQVILAYSDLLGRDPDPSGLQFWTAALERGLPLEALQDFLAASPEYVSQQAGLALPILGDGSGIVAGLQGPLAITLQAPDFTTSSAPAVTLNVTPGFVGRVRIDVDFQHDGSFTDLGDQNQTVGVVTPDAATFTLNPLPRGTYLVRARAQDVSGAVAVSQPVLLVTDPDGGVVGSQALLNLSAAYQAARPGKGEAMRTFLADRSPLLNFDAEGRVEVDVHATLPQYLGGLEADLEQAGMQVLAVDLGQDMVTGYLPVSMIPQLPQLAHFYGATPVYAPLLRTGSAESQGDAVIGAVAFRATQGVTGAGIKVGVVSDSVNQVDGGIAQSQRTGDLPPQGVQVLEDGPAQGATDEGRAMLEIINDVAPGASLAFHTGAISPQDMAAGIQALADAGARVIVDDVGYFDSPFFNDGIIAQAVDKVVSQGVFYASAAGNDGSQGYLAPWRSTTASVGGTTGTFDDLGGGNPLQQFTLAPGQSFTLDFQWDQAFLEGGSTQPNFQVPSEIDVLVTTADGQQVLADFNDNTLNTNEAVQIGTFANDGSFGTNNFAFAFLLKQGPAPTLIRWIASGDDPHAAGEGAPTIWGQPAAQGAVAVGAVPWFAPAQAEPFNSSGGGIPILFDAQGNRLAQPEIRLKPEVAGPDGVDTSFFGSNPSPGDPDQHPRFFGTSAAAPHVAGAAALLLQQFPAATPALLAAHLEQTARDVAAPGFDAVTGFGLIQVKPFTAPASAPVLSDDRFEPNDTSDQATELGLLMAGTRDFPGLSIAPHLDGLPDNDWYRAAVAQNGTLTVKIQYQTLGGDLDLRVYTQDGDDMLIPLASSLLTNSTSQQVAIPVRVGEPILIWVYGFDHAEGSYDLTITLG